MSTENKPDLVWASAIGQDSHRFLARQERDDHGSRPLVLAGIVIPGEPALAGNSDADVVLHALINAISGLTGVNILGEVADRLCLEGKTDSAVYLKEALNNLRTWQINHVSISVECRRPRLSGWISQMKENIAQQLSLGVDQIGLTATSGEGLTAFGQGEGIQVFCIVSGYRPA